MTEYKFLQQKLSALLDKLETTNYADKVYEAIGRLIVDRAERIDFDDNSMFVQGKQHAEWFPEESQDKK